MVNIPVMRKGNSRVAGHRLSRQHFLSLLAVLGACAFARIWLIVHTDVIARDGVTYVRMAQDWLDSPRRVVDAYDYHVGYPAVLAGMHRLVFWLGGPAGIVGWDLAGQLVSLVASLAAMVAVWLFAAMAFNRRLAWITTLLFGVGRNWAVLGADVLSDAPAVCLAMWAMVFALWTLALIQRRSKWAVALASVVGFCAGVGYLFRPEALLVAVLAIGLWLAYQAWSRVSWPLTLASAAAALLWTAACAASYAIAIGGLSKKKSLSEIIPVVRDAAPTGVIAVVEAGMPDLALREVIAEGFEAMHPIVATLACVWLVTWVGARVLRLNLPKRVCIFPRGPAAFLMVAATLTVVIMLIGLHLHVHYVSCRHLMFLAALLSPLGGAGVAIGGRWLSLFAEKLGRRRIRDGLFSSLIALGLAAGLLGHTLRPLHKDKACYRETGLFLGRTAGPEDFIVADRIQILHYAQRPGAFVPRAMAGRPELVEYIRRTAATYVALTGEAHGQENGPLAEALRRPPFILMRQFGQAGAERDRTVYLYKFDPEGGGSRVRSDSDRP